MKFKKNDNFKDIEKKFGSAFSSAHLDKLNAMKELAESYEKPVYKKYLDDQKWLRQMAYPFQDQIDSIEKLCEPYESLAFKEEQRMQEKVGQVRHSIQDNMASKAKKLGVHESSAFKQLHDEAERARQMLSPFQDKMDSIARTYGVSERLKLDKIYGQLIGSQVDLEKALLGSRVAAKEAFESLTGNISKDSQSNLTKKFQKAMGMTESFKDVFSTLAEKIRPEFQASTQLDQVATSMTGIIENLSKYHFQPQKMHGDILNLTGTLSTVQDFFEKEWDENEVQFNEDGSILLEEELIPQEEIEQGIKELFDSSETSMDENNSDTLTKPNLENSVQKKKK